MPSDPLRLGVDVSKIASHDGIGTFERGILAGLDEIVRDDGAEEILVRLYDPHGTYPHGIDGSPAHDPAEAPDFLSRDGAVRKELAPCLVEGELARAFESRVGTPPDDDEIDVLLVVGWAIPSAWRGPILYVVHDLTFLTHPRCHTVDNRIHCLEGVLEALQRDASLVAISSATAGALVERFGVDEKSLRVIPPAPARFFRPGDPETTERRLGERFGLDPGYVLAVGSLEPRKNLERLVAAHAALPDDVRSAHPLVVAGAGGWRNAALTAALDAAESRGDVHRLGRISADDLVTLYRGAALFAYPSLAEGFGLPVVEAMGCGTPVLTSSVSSLPEAAGGAARLVDPTDAEALGSALEELLKDADERAELAAAGRERVRELSWRRTAEELVALARERRPSR